MKARIILTGATLILGMTANAQININKIKNKASEVKSTKNEVENKNKEAEAKKEEDKLNASPAAESIRKFRFFQGSFKDAVERRDNYLTSKMKQLDELIAKIRKDDPNWVELAKDEAAYAESKKLYDDAMAADNLENALENYDRDAKSMQENNNYYDERAIRLDRKKYDDLKNQYTAKGEKNEKIDQYITRVDAFYASGTSKPKGYLNDEAKKALERAAYTNAEGRKNPKYIANFDEDNSRYALNELTTALKKADALLQMVPGDADVTALKNKLEANKKDIEDYKASAQFQTDIAAHKQFLIDQILLDKAGRKDPQMDALVKRDMAKENGQVLRIVLISKDYYIEKNDLGLPLRKVVDVHTANKGTDGKCYRVTGFITSEYEGGGVYGKPNYHTYSSTEMNCNNVNK